MKNGISGFSLFWLWCLLLGLVAPVFVKADAPFQIVWGMNQTLSGASSSTNFSPSDAVLVGAAPHSLPTIRYYSIGTNDWAFGTTAWHVTGVEKYLSLSFSVSTHQYSISSVSFRIRRSDTGPQNVSLRSSTDGFAADLTSFNLSTDGVFYQITVPMGLDGLTSGLTFRLHGSNPSGSTGVLYFDQIIIAGTVTSIVLPVYLTKFKAQAKDRTVLLEWETGWEQYTSKFVVERSQDLDHFAAVGEIAAAGMSSERRPYRFVDEAPEEGINYYRLRLVDEGGKYGFSKVVEAIISTGRANFVVSPNPALSSRIRIKTGVEVPDEMLLTSLSGHRIAIISVLRSGNFMDLFPNHVLSSGIYVLSLRHNGKWLIQKVLIP
jgi:hypothetical protein